MKNNEYTNIWHEEVQRYEESSLPWDINRRFGRDGVRMPRQQIYDMSFGKVYDCLIAKAERKGRTRDEVDELVDELAKGKAVEKIKRG